MTDVTQLTVPVQRWIARRRRHDVERHLGPGAGSTSSDVRIRGRRSHDLAAAARLLGLVVAEGQYPLPRPESRRAWLTGPGIQDAWIAERDGELLGHIALSRVGLDAVSAMRWREVTGRATADLAGVSRFFVRSRVRGQGIGTSLLQAAVTEARARGLVPVAEMMSASRDGIRLYEKQGWRLAAMYPCGPRSASLEAYMYVLAAPKTR